MKKIWSIDFDYDNDCKGLKDNSILVSNLTISEFKKKFICTDEYSYDMPANLKENVKYNWLIYKINHKVFILEVYEKD